jgi:Carboxypeptidase regulatory-like domain
MKRFVRCLLPLCAFVGSQLPDLVGQTTSTEVTGIVSDGTGLPVQADVSLTRIDTGEARHELTNHQGIYVFRLIEPSTYRIVVKASGFKITTINKLDVIFQQRARVDVKLEVGQLSQSVQVTAEARLLNTEDAAVGQALEQKRVVDLPIGYRQVGYLAITMPGVSFGEQSGATGAGARTSPAGATVDLVAYGQPSQTQGVTLDGVDIKEPRYNRMTLQPSIDAIEEFKVQTATYSSEYGFSGGAQIQISMKSGTNALHGSAYDFLRNSALDAESYFLNYNLAPGAARNPKNPLHRNVFGVYLGGPVIIPKLYHGKNRTFFSYNYEGRREVQGVPTNGWFPTDAMKSGNFSTLLTRPQGAITIFDPLSGVPFANNIIPASRINPGAQTLMKYLIEPQFQQSDPLSYTNRVSLPNPITQSAWFMRFDHNITDKDRAFLRLAWDHQDWAVPTLNPNFGETYYNVPKSLAIAYTHIFSPTILNEFRYGFMDLQTQDFNKRSYSNFDENSLGIGTFLANSPTGPRPLNNVENRIPPIGLSGITGQSPFMGDIYGLGIDSSMIYSLSDHVSIVRNKHAFKMGGEFHRSAMTRAAANYPGGQLNFSPNESGFSFASFLLGYVDTAETPEGNPLTIPVQNLWALYLLDDWKLTPRLTINYGLRYDHVGIPYDRGGYWRTISLSQLYTTPQGDKIPTFVPTTLGSSAAVPLFHNTEGIVMPRLGIAYRLGKWVLRTGSGLYDNSAHFNVYTIMNLTPPYSAGSQFAAITQAANANTRMFTPGSFVLQMGPNLFNGPSKTNPLLLYSVQPDRKNDTHWQWSFDIQRELPLGTALTISYVGSKTSNGSAILSYWNAAQPSSNTNFQARRPIQYFYDPLAANPIQQAGSINMIVSGLNNYYEGATISLDKRYSNGLAFGINYTYSLANGQSQGPQDNINGQDPQNWRDSKGPLVFNQRNRTIANFVYELPYRRNGKGALGLVLGGWQVGGIATIATGLPYNITQGDDVNSGKSQDGGQIRPDVVGNPNVATQTLQQWYNPLAFQRVTCNIPSRPDLCHWGSAGENILNAPSARNLDFSMTKSFRVTEWVKVQFRAEAFNAFNHPWFGAPVNIGFVNTTSITPNSPNQGQILSLTNTMRTMQLGLKVLW